MVSDIVKDHSDSKKRNLLLQLHGLLFPISSKGYFKCTIPHTGKYILWPLLHQLWRSGWNERKDGNVLFNNLFYLWLYGHMVNILLC